MFVSAFAFVLAVLYLINYNFLTNVTNWIKSYRVAALKFEILGCRLVTHVIIRYVWKSLRYGLVTIKARLFSRSPQHAKF